MTNNNLYKAIRSVFGDNEFYAGDVVRQSRYVARKEQRELAEVLRATFGRRVTGRMVGHFLNKHSHEVPEGLTFEVVTDRRRRQKIYCIFEPVSVEEIEADIEARTEAFKRKRAKDMAGKNLMQQIRQLEKDQRKLDQVEENRRKVEATREQRRIDKANQAAQQEMERAEMAARTATIVAPRMGFWIEQWRAEKLLNQFVEKGFKASIGFVVGARPVIRIDGTFDIKQLKAEAFRLGLIVRQERTQAAKAKESTEQIWNNELQRWMPKPTAALPLGYDPDLRYLNRTADPPRTGPPVRSNPIFNFGWKIF